MLIKILEEVELISKKHGRNVQDEVVDDFHHGRTLTESTLGMFTSSSATSSNASCLNDDYSFEGEEDDSNVKVISSTVVTHVAPMYVRNRREDLTEISSDQC